MNDEIAFKPRNFWEAAYNQPLEKLELDQIQENATAFVKFMMEEKLMQKRRNLEVEIYKIDRELSDLDKNIFPITTIEERHKKFESLLANMQVKK